MEANGPFYAKREGDRFILGLSVEDRHCNAIGVCHGGMIATLCDVLLTVGGNIQSRQSRFLPTISMTCDFLAPASVGAWIEGHLDILSTTRNLMFVAGVLEVASCGPFARTSAVLKVGGERDPRFDADRYFE